MNSLSVFTGTDGLTISARGCIAVRATGTKSLSVAYGSRVYSAGLITIVPVLASSRVWPSGADFITSCAPTVPPAPAL